MKYTIMEFNMLPETEAELRKIAKENEMTLDDVVEVGMRGMIANPAQIKEMVQYYQDHPEEYSDITFVREYPVLHGETEAQARKRRIADERAHMKSDE